MSAHEVILVALAWFAVGMYVGLHIATRSRRGGEA